MTSLYQGIHRCMSQFYHPRDNGGQHSGYGCHHRLVTRWSPDRTGLFQWYVLSLNLARLTASLVGGLGLINNLFPIFLIKPFLSENLFSSEVSGGVENW